MLSRAVPIATTPRVNCATSSFPCGRHGQQETTVPNVAGSRFSFSSFIFSCRCEVAQEPDAHQNKLSNKLSNDTKMGVPGAVVLELQLLEYMPNYHQFWGGTCHGACIKNFFQYLEVSFRGKPQETRQIRVINFEKGIFKSCDFSAFFAKRFPGPPIRGWQL